MNRIKQLRDERMMSQVALSIRLGVSQETVSAYENGKHYPSVQILIELSQIFSVSCDYILGLSEERYSSPNDLSNELDKKLLYLFKSLSSHNKDLAIAYIQGLHDSNLI